MNTSQPILEILQKDLIPWIREFGLQHLIVAAQQMRQLKLPTDVSFTRKKTVGSRQAMRGKKDNLTSAYWPDDNLVESRVPLLVFVVKGQADLNFANYILHCPQSHYVFILPEVPRMNGATPHLMANNQENGYCELLWLRPYGEQMQCWTCYSRGDQHYDAKHNERLFIMDSHLSRLFDDLWQELTATSSKEEIPRRLLELFLLYMQRALRENRFLYFHATRQDDLPATTGYQPIIRAQEYIRSHLNQSLTLEKLARLVHLSRTQFAMRFRKETGQTFTEFVTQCRIKQAKVLLQETDANIAYISRLLGYKSVAYFYEIFKRRVGVSPAIFRQNIASKNSE